MGKLLRKLRAKTELWMCEVHGKPMAYSWCDHWWHCEDGFESANCTQLDKPDIMGVKG